MTNQSVSTAATARRIEAFCRAKASDGPHPISRSRELKNEIHSIFSIKAGLRIVHCESPLEADAILYAEAQPDIVSLCEQSPRIHGAILNKPVYTFDYTVRYKDKTRVFVEVKPAKKLTLLEDGRRCPSGWPYIEAWCRSNSETCAFITDEDLAPHQQLIANWRQLLPYARRAYLSPDPALERSILTHVSRAKSLAINELRAREASVIHDSIINYIAKLLHKGALSADLSSLPVSPVTVLSVPAAVDLESEEDCHAPA